MDYLTNRLAVRDLCWADLDAMHAFKSDPLVTRHTDFGVKTLDESRDWLTGCIHHNTLPKRIAHNCAIVLGERGAALAGREVGEPIGWIGFGRPDADNMHGDLDFGYALRREFWGKGYMTEALVGMIDFIFTTTTAQSIFSECEAANPASARVMEKAGMELITRYTWQNEATGNIMESLRYQIERTNWHQ